MLNVMIDEKWKQHVLNSIRLLHYVPIECSGGTLIDVGANIGAYSMLFGHLFDKIVCVQACKANVQRLKKNIKDRSLDVKTQVMYNAAFSRDNQKVKLMYCQINGQTDYFSNSGNLSIMKDKLPGDTYQYDQKNGFQQVQTVSLQRLISLYGDITMMKVDIQGAQKDFLLNKDLSRIKFLDVQFHMGRQKTVFPYIQRTHGFIGQNLFKRM